MRDFIYKILLFFSLFELKIGEFSFIVCYWDYCYFLCLLMRKFEINNVLLVWRIFIFDFIFILRC